MKQKVFLPIENDWAITEVTDLMGGDDPAVFVVYVENIHSRGMKYPARFDVNKGVFLDTLPITTDAANVRNLLRNLISKRGD